MHKTISLSAIALFTLLLMPAPGFSALTGREVMQKQQDLHNSKTEVELQKMILIDKKGTKEQRQLRRFSKEVEDDVFRTLVAFLGPADIKGTALLTWEHKQQSDDQWLYLPAQGKMQRIAEGGKRSSFMGTDFTYEDLESEQLDDYEYTILREEALEGTDCWVIEAAPATEHAKKESGYSKRILWVTKDQYTTLKIDFYDRRKKLLKTKTTYDWSNVQGTIWRPAKTLMQNHKNNHQTLIGAVKREINQDIQDQQFTERFILKGLHTQ